MTDKNYQLSLEQQLAALKEENERLKQLKRSGRAIDDYALIETDIVLENNVSKLYAMYMLLSLYFYTESYNNEVENYIHKIEMFDKKPSFKVIASLIARVSKSLILSKKNEAETEIILYKKDGVFQNANNDDEVGF